jgi:hypothetical protein
MHSAVAETLSNRRRKTTLITIDSLDGRTHAARQVNVLRRSLQRQLGRKPTTTEGAAIERAAVLQVLAADARNRILRGDRSVSYDAMVRADGAARRAMRDLQAIARQSKPDLGSNDDIAAIFASNWDSSNG